MEEVCPAAALLCQVTVLLQDRITVTLNTHVVWQPCHVRYFHSIKEKFMSSFLNGFGGTSS